MDDLFCMMCSQPALDGPNQPELDDYGDLWVYCRKCDCWTSHPVECICSKKCDCEDPNGENGVVKISNKCPEHNDYQLANPYCNAKPHWFEKRNIKK